MITKKLLPMFAFILLFGCASPEGRWDYPPFSIVRASKSKIEKFCISPHIVGRVLCCYDPKERIIYASNPDCLVHELCHVFKQEPCEMPNWSWEFNSPLNGNR